MRLKPLALITSLASLATIAPSQAASIVQNIPGLNQSLGDFTPFDINAVPFNTALGSLTDVSVELIGSFTPASNIDVLGTIPATITLTSHLFVFATLGGPTDNIPLGSQTLPAPGAGGTGQVNTVGTPTPVDSVADLTFLSSFETGYPTSQLLIEYGFRTSNSLVGSGVSDVTTFSGSAILTYTYDAPEPASVLVFASGLLGLAWSRRRSA